MIAREEDSAGCVRVLLAHGADPHATENCSTRGNALHVCTLFGHYDVARELLENGARVDDLDGNARSPRRISQCLGFVCVGTRVRTQEFTMLGLSMSALVESSYSFLSMLLAENQRFEVSDCDRGSSRGARP